MTSNEAKFRETLAGVLTRLFPIDPQYATLAKRSTPEDLAAELTDTLKNSITPPAFGKAIIQVCQTLGIPLHLRRIRAYLTVTACDGCHFHLPETGDRQASCVHPHAHHSVFWKDPDSYACFTATTSEVRK